MNGGVADARSDAARHGPARAAGTAAVDEYEAEGAVGLTFSVVICTCDRADTLGRAVESVATQTVTPLEVLVVDQSRTDDSRRVVEELQGRYPRVRYMHLDQRGLARASNIGVRATTGDVVAFTDDDCVAPAGWLAAIARAFEQHPEVALLYGQVATPEDFEASTGLSRADGVIPTLEFGRRRMLDKRNGFVVFGMGANFAVRRSAFERIGGFDEVLGGGGPLRSSQDFDFSYRIFRSGGAVLLEPDVIVRHYGFRAHKDWPATLVAYGVGDGGFYLKHVRIGDLYATGLLARVLVISALREAKRSALSRRRDNWTYVLNVFVGMRRSFEFGVDARHRVYVPRVAH
jgi:GT2 family glycosyltransferase